MFIGLIPMANKEKMKIENKQALYSAYFIVVVGTDIIWWYILAWLYLGSMTSGTQTGS